MFMAWKQSG
jgi:hypothetical protein